MSIELRLGVAFAIATLAASALTPLARALALRTSFLDRPVGYKRHAAPTPYLGGLAVVSAFALTAALVGRLDRMWLLVVGALVLCALGTLDDRRTVRPSYRVATEAALGAGLWVTDLGWSVTESELVNLTVTILWIVTVVNAFNLMDNMDGSAPACAVASALGIAGLAVSTGQYGVAVLALALTGACAGFLPFNLRNPARIFLGDGGSMPIGFLAGALAMAIPALEPGSEWVGLAAVLLVGVPLTDTTLVTISRRRRGISFLSGGRDHMTHRLLGRLGSARLVALALAAAQASLAVLAIVGSELGHVPLAWISAVCVLLAGATIVSLEEGALSLSEGSSETARAAPVLEARPTRSNFPVRTVLAAGIGLACGASPLLAGFYSFSVWGPIGLGLLALLFALFVAGEEAPDGLALTALGGLALMALLALLSTTWGESADRALIEASRWIVYAAFLGTVLLLIRSDRMAGAALAGGATGLLATAGYILAVALTGDGPSLFQSGRLFEPLGYVNSQGLFLVAGFWPLVAVAQYGRNGLVAGLGAAGAAAMTSLALLTQARGVAFAIVASMLAVMLFVPGRQRRAWLLLCVFGAVFALSAPLLDVYQTADEATIRDAAWAVLLAAAIAGLVWGIGVALVRQQPSAAAARASAAGLVLVVVAALVAMTANAPAIADRVETEARAFRNLDASGGRSRLLSGGGNRYDFWRIAAREFTGSPLAGVGAGNYTRDYFVRRRTTEDIRQPHSIEMQALSELGLLGGACLALFLLAVAAGWRRRVKHRSLEPQDRALLVAAGGVFSAWLAHSSVDWSHLVPGAAGLAFVAAAYLVTLPAAAPASREPSEPLLRGAGRITLRAAIGVATAVAAVALARPVLAHHYRAQGKEALASDPVRSLAKARDSSSLNDQAVETQYLRAAAFARLGDYARARGSLLRAADLEPHNYVPWALLGDLALRRGDLRLARASYARASRLNPREPALRRLRGDPRRTSARP